MPIGELVKTALHHPPAKEETFSSCEKFKFEEEIMRIWKGLHYCFWMSDKPLVQEELAETIGEFY